MKVDVLLEGSQIANDFRVAIRHFFTIFHEIAGKNWMMGMGRCGGGVVKDFVSFLKGAREKGSKKATKSF